MTSPNKITKDLELEGATVTLAVDLNFYRTFHRLTGKDLLNRTEAEAKLNPDEIVALLYAAMRSGKSDIVLNLPAEEGMEKVGDLIHPKNLAAVGDAIEELMQANSPAAKNGADPKVPVDAVTENPPIG